jgi:hypothetical protein
MGATQVRCSVRRCAGIERDRILNYRTIAFVRSCARELNGEARVEHEA